MQTSNAIEQLLDEVSFEKKEFVPGYTYIPVSGSLISRDDVRNLIEVAIGKWYTDSRWCTDFRRALKKYTHHEYITLCNSGSSADLLALSALKDRPGKYVITTAVGFPTTVYPIYYIGKVPIFIDMDEKTLSPDMGALEYCLKHYKDIAGGVFTHTLGIPYPEDCVKEMLGDRWLIADNCDAMLAQYKGRSVGHWADVSTYSFFPAHHISCGEGGAVGTNNPRIHGVIESLSSWGRDCRCKPGQNNVCGHRFDQTFPNMPEGYDHKYIFSRLGYNLKMTEFQAALGLSQSENLQDWVFQRCNNFQRLLKGLLPLKGLIEFVQTNSEQEISPFGFPILVPENAKYTCHELVDYLEKNHIGTRPLFGGNLTRQPAFSNLPYHIEGYLNGSDAIMGRMFWIGVWPGITDDMVDYMVETIKKFFRERNL